MYGPQKRKGFRLQIQATAIQLLLGHTTGVKFFQNKRLRTAIDKTKFFCTKNSRKIMNEK